MNNETTASQPKSIGDDAQFHRLMSEWQLCLTTDITKSFAAVVSYIDNFRAPAAQASATIQEPVMVAEPVGVATLIDSIESGLVEIVTASHSNLSGTATNVRYVAEELQKEIDAYRVAAPMVADPAGVAVCGACEGIGSYEHKDADTCCRVCGGTGLAATVKAVPSEALRVPIEHKAVDPHVPAMVRMTTKTFNPANNSVIFKCHHCKREERHDQAKVGADQWFICEGKDFFLLSGRDKFVDYAPLADKTGGAQ